MQYKEIKEQKQTAYNKLIDTCNMFFAFSNEQFAEGAKKHPLKESEKYLSIGAGGYMPKHNLETFEKGVEEIEKTFKAQIKEFKMREKHILYELNNHECFYTGDITTAVDALGEDYTAEECNAVLKKFRAQKYTGKLSIEEIKQKYA